MAELSSKPQPLSVAIEVKYPVDPLEITHVNVIRFTHLGSDVFMDLAILDDQALVAAQAVAKGVAGTAGGTESRVPAYVIRRFGMTTDALGMIKRNVDEIWRKLQAVGIVPQEEP